MCETAGLGGRGQSPAGQRVWAGPQPGSSMQGGLLPAARLLHAEGSSSVRGLGGCSSVQGGSSVRGPEEGTAGGVHALSSWGVAPFCPHSASDSGPVIPSRCWIVEEAAAGRTVGTRPQGLHTRGTGTALSRAWGAQPGAAAERPPFCLQQAARGQRALHLRAAEGGRLPAARGRPVSPVPECLALRRRAPALTP